MSDKERKKAGPSARAPELAHSPFAALAGRPVVASAEPSATAAASAPVAPEPRLRGRLVQRRETKQRGGKAVIVVSGFGALAGLDRAAVERLAKELKQKLGSGGTVEEGRAGLEIVIQGDQAQKVAELLRALGFRVEGVTR